MSGSNDELSKFVTALFKHAVPGTWVHLRAFHETQDAPWRPSEWRAVQVDEEPNKLDEVISEAVRISGLINQESDPVVFCPPVATFQNTATSNEQNIANGLVILIDCDRDPQQGLHRVEAVIGPATLVVASGGIWEGQDKLHCYWVLRQATTTPEEHALLKSARQLGARLAVSDPTSAPLSHPIRWAGTWHRKAEPRLAQVIYTSDNEVDLATAHALLRAAVGDSEPAHAPSATAASPEDLRAAFEVIPNTDIDWDKWNDLGMALWAATHGSAQGQEIWEVWSAKAAKNNPDRTTARWQHYASSPPSRIGAGSIFFAAQQAVPGWRPPSYQAPPDSDEALAVAFVNEREADLRYTEFWKRWYHWTGNYWREDRTLVAFNLTREFCRRVARAAQRGGKQLASARTVSAISQLSKADQRIAASIDQWDANPWLLGTIGGTIDLQRGIMQTNGASDYITRITPVSPTSTQDCPTWIAALNQITNGQQDLIDYFQRMAGYCLTGSVREEKLFFLYGSGGNGKGTFIETLGYVLGAYATTVAMSTLVMTQHAEHPTEIAKLLGTRLAVASETNEAARWNSAKIKSLTGGDKLTARYMRGDYFDFPPTHKLVVSSNRRPLLGRVDTALARRIVMIPFDHVFTTPDLTMKDKLRSEAPGILAWMIEGCLLWQRWGLHAPASVELTTQQYLHDQDDIQIFVDERCDVDASALTPSSILYAAWQDWCKAAGVFPGSKKDFTQRLKLKFKDRVIHNLTHFIGVRLTSTFSSLTMNQDDLPPPRQELSLDLPH